MLKDLICLLFLTILASSCADLHQSLETKNYYPHDMEVVVNKNKVGSVGAIPLAASYDFKIKTPGKIDLLMYSNCHKSPYQEEAYNDEDEWFESKYEAKFNFKPTDELEKHGCPLLISAYEKVLGRHSTAFFDFEDSNNTMPAQMLCNGIKLNLKGVGVCQSRAELIQKLIFPVKVLAEAMPECPKIEDNKSELLIPLGRGYCVYNFISAEKEDNRKFRLTTYGWDEPILRKE